MDKVKGSQAIKDVKASKRIHKILQSNELKVEFGKGKLMPVFVKSSEEVGIIISEVKKAGLIGHYVTDEEVQESVIGSTPLTHLSFPNNKSGKQCISILKEWLDTMEEYMDVDSEV